MEETGLKIVSGHSARLKVDVEQGAKLPGTVADDPAFGFEALVERGVGKCGLKCDLHFVKP